MVICKLCNKKCKTLRSFSYHLKCSHSDMSKENYYNIFLKKENEDVCVVCKKTTNFISLSQGYNNTCSRRCRTLNPSAKNKMKKTNLEKYGVEHVGQSDKIKEKIKNSLILKYGVDHISKLDEIKNKKIEINLQKFGVDHISKSKIIQNKKRSKYYNNILLNSNRLQNKVIPLFSENEYKGTKKINKYKFKCTACNNIFFDHIDNGRVPRCNICNPIPYTSKYEDELIDFLKSCNINVKKSNRSVIKPYELDIYIPDYKLAIEFNGLYWHRESKLKDKTYHLIKTKKCNKKGIQLIHIFEDEWIHKKEIVKSIILNKLKKNTTKIYAKKCKIKIIKNNDAALFLKENCIFDINEFNFNMGLFYENELVSIISIKFNNEQNELVHFCTKIDTIVVGGFSKLISNFMKNYKTPIIIKNDLRYFSGIVYQKNNFNFIKRESPNYYLLEDNYNNKIREDNMEKDKKYIDKIWDCGYDIYTF